MKKTNKPLQIDAILALPASPEYNRVEKLKQVTAGTERLIALNRMVDGDDVSSLTFREFSILYDFAPPAEGDNTLAKKLLNFKDWNTNDLRDWSSFLISFGLEKMIATFPHELWVGKNINPLQILQKRLEDCLFHDYRWAPIIMFFSNRQNFRVYFKEAMSIPLFADCFRAHNFGNERFRALFGDNFAEDTLERFFYLDLMYGGGKIDNVVKFLAKTDTERVNRFFDRHLLSVNEVNQLADDDPALLERYVARQYLSDFSFPKLIQQFPQMPFAGSFSSKTDTLNFCRQNGIDTAFAQIAKLGDTKRAHALEYLSSILAEQLTCEVTPEHWKPLLKDVDARVYLEVRKYDKLLQTLHDAGFVPTSDFLEEVEKTRVYLENLDIDLC